MDDTTVEVAETADVENPTETDLENAETADETTEGGQFSRGYVEHLRNESKTYRDRADAAEARTEELRHRLWTAQVSATGKLADPADFPFDPADTDLMDDPEAFGAAIDELIAAKPHLRSRIPTGSIAQGVRGAADEPFTLMGALKALV